MTLDRALADLPPQATITGYTEQGRPFAVIVGGGTVELERYRSQPKSIRRGALAHAQADLLERLGPTATVYDALRALRPF
jgi:hypothetical protein